MEIRIPAVNPHHRLAIEPARRNPQKDFPLASLGIHRANRRALQTLLKSAQLENARSPLSRAHRAVQFDENLERLGIGIVVPACGQLRHDSGPAIHSGDVNRRTFLSAAASAASADADTAIPIIDTHIHLFDPARPQGVPWPAKDNAVLYQPALPERYRKIAAPLGVTGAIEVECSPWLEDNQWVLDVAAKDKTILGTVGNLEPGKPDFRKHLDRFHRNPLFLGIRYGNLWGRDLGAELSNPTFVSDLKALSDAGLELDTANPNAALIADVLRLTDRVPTLRIVVDHLPQMAPAPSFRELAKRPQVYVKVSEVLRREDGRVPLDLAFYRSRLDELWDVFGEDRLIYGSDWPNSDQWGPYPRVLSVVREYFNGKGGMASEKYFWRNSIAAYRWVKRAANQPQGWIP
jgi:L-fuconolactonase